MEHARRRERSRVVRALRLLRSRNPRTFTEKVRFKVLRDRRPMLVTFADKAAVRDYVADRVGGGYLPRAYGILDDPDDIAGLELPDRYVIKPTHGSGAAIVVSPAAPADARLPEARWRWTYRHVDPAHVDRAHLATIGHHWMRQLYAQGPHREWADGLVPRRVLIEEMLAGADGSIPNDYKVFVFHGRAHFVQVDAGRFGGRTQDFYTSTWTHLPMSGGPPWAHPRRPRPERLDEILHVAETLRGETDFVRVDLYSLPDRIAFGELTSYPAGGESPFDPISFDAEFGRPWTVPRRY